MNDEPDPRDDAPPPRRLLSPWFWLALIFGLGCIVAGFAVARLGPRYF